MTSQLPDFLLGERRQVGAQSATGMGQPPVSYISIDGGRFTLVDANNAEMPVQTFGPIFTQRQPDGSETPIQGTPVGLYLDVVLVDANENMSKTYYIKSYDPNSQRYMPPDCWSDNGVAPSTGALHPQCERCDICPMNDWGSKVNNLGNEVKACDDVKKLAFIIPALGNNMTFLLRLKGSSHKFWRGYVEKVSKQSLGTRPLDVTDIVTRIYFEPIPGKTGFLNFHWLRLIDQPIAQIQDAIWKARATDAQVGRLDKPRTLALPAPGGQAAQPAQSQWMAPPPPAAVVPPPPAPPSAQPTFVIPPQPVAQQPAQQPAPAAPPAPRQRRQRAQAQPAAPQQPGFAAPPAQPAPPPNPTQPSFMQAPPQPTAPAPAAPPPPPPNFGMAPANPNVPSELEAALADALKPLN